MVFLKLFDLFLELLMEQNDSSYHYLLDYLLLFHLNTIDNSQMCIHYLVLYNLGLLLMFVPIWLFHLWLHYL